MSRLLISRTSEEFCDDDSIFSRKRRVLAPKIQKKCAKKKKKK